MIKPGDLFFALPGAAYDGHDFIDKAISAGAVCIVCEKDFENDDVVMIKVPDSRHALALMASKYYDFPSHKLKVAGITGTNGKTTVTYMVKSIFEARNKSTGLIGTIEYLAGSHRFDAFNTTPESLHIERLLAIMHNEQIHNVVMEVSSHGLAMGRVRMIDFNVGAITNITQDHLDYHTTMEEYREAKAILFDKLKGKQKWAVLNMDDPSFDFFLGRVESSYLTYALENSRADLFLSEVEKVDDGFIFRLHTPLGVENIHLKLTGRFNLNNALCAAAVAMASGLDSGSVKQGLENMTAVPGRMEKVDFGQNFRIYVDYAHTPDALGNVMKSARELANAHKLIAVFGCGGDRDKAKRPLMSAAVSEYADLTILTSDNPRTEDPLAIIEDAKVGLIENKEHEIIPDRRQAIQEAVRKASEGDVVVIAGKGHETIQIIGTDKTHFDDREVIREVIQG